VNAWIKKIHMYAGLLNFTILCVFGLAGLVATAEAPDIFSGNKPPGVSTMPFSAPGSASDAQVAELIRRRLQPPHAGAPFTHRDERRRLVADFYSVNGLVRATLLESQGQLQVETFRNSIWRFFDNAHATTIQETAYDWAPGVWAWYVELSIWSLIVMSLTGLWLGLATRWPFWWTKASFAVGTLAFAIFYWVQK
jgi:hypothetical protein